MPRGRPKKPTALKVLEGNPGKRPLPQNEPKPTPISPECPKWLDREAKNLWKQLVPELERLGLITVIDGEAFAAACQSYATWVRCQKFFKKKNPDTKKPYGMTFTTPNGYIQQRPEVTIGNKALADFRAFCTEFGLTPASRTRINIKPTDKEDPMEALLSGVK